MIVAPHPATPEDVARYYDRLDAHYRLIWGTHLHHGFWSPTGTSQAAALARLREQAMVPLRPKSGDHWVDVGCGYGAFGHWLVENQSLRVTGYTISPTQAQFGQTHYATVGLDLRHGDWLENALSPNCADGLVSLECLCHIPNKRRFFQEVFRVLKPGARAAITALTCRSRPATWLRLGLLQPLCQAAGFPNLPETQELPTWAEREGLEVLTYRTLTRQVRPTWPRLALRTGRLLRRTIDGTPQKPDWGAQEFAVALNGLRLVTALYAGAMDYQFLVLRKPD